MNYLNFFNEDFPTAIGLILGILVTGFTGSPRICIVFVILLFTVVWFYRAPHINIPQYTLQSNEMFSPAFGTVEKIEHVDGRYKIAIKLELWDIHIQYFPVSGEVFDQTRTLYTVTTKIRDLKLDAADRVISVTQRTGYVARRIATPETRGPVFAGHRLGMIKFGSHVDLEIPDRYTLQIKVGDYLNGPYTKIAEWAQ
jgi:phosphatidylserine decarboxylase precursor-related protein